MTQVKREDADEPLGVMELALRTAYAEPTNNGDGRSDRGPVEAEPSAPAGAREAYRHWGTATMAATTAVSAVACRPRSLPSSRSRPSIR